MTRHNIYNYLFIVLPLLLLPDLLIAQQPPGEKLSCKREELAQQRNSFFAQELHLTDEEADYLDHILRMADEKKIPLWRELREQYETIKAQTLSEEQASSYLEREQQIKARLAEINEQTLTELRKQISASKLLNYQQVRLKFAKKFIKHSQPTQTDDTK